jgi:D-methionine transport system permease protein
MSFVDVLLAILETLGMTLIGTVLAYVLGFPLGILLNITSKNGIKPNKVLNSILGTFVNVMRSIPCLLLIVILLPFTRMLLGRSTGEWYVMIIPIFVGAFGFVARIVESSLNEVDGGVIEASKSMGASTWQIIKKVLIVESLPSLINGISVATINIIGFTAFAYDFGAGGLISKAYSFYKNNTKYFVSYDEFFKNPDLLALILTIVLIVILVQVIQVLGQYFSKKIDKRRKAK